MIVRTARNFSTPHKNSVPGPLDEKPKPKISTTAFASRVQPKQMVLRFDINTLLSLFNEMQVTGSGQISKKGLRKIMQIIGLQQEDSLLKYDSYTFDAFLSLLGQIEFPTEPSVYVLSFVKILANYRDKCLQHQTVGLEQANEVQLKIKTITQSEIERQKQHIKTQHSKIYDEMQISQQKQFLLFESQWQNYLREFKQETARRMQETKYNRKSQIIEEENKFLKKVRRNSVLTSPRMTELTERKRLLIRDKRYQNAIEINYELARERERLSESKQEANDKILTKKLQKLTTKTNHYLGAIEKNLEVNLIRLISKKKEGQSIMRLRMKNLREEANRKLNDHYRNEINRLRSSFYMAANH